MSRILLDTNVATQILMGDWDEFSPRVHEIVINPFENQLYLSTFSGMELIHLHIAEKIDNGRKQKYTQPADMFYTLENIFHVSIKPFANEHMLTLAHLIRRHNHNDPVDHAIISHAITEKLTLISSDKKFGFYTKQGLDFIFNDRNY